MKKIAFLALFGCIFANSSYADTNYPQISGESLLEFRSDYITNSKNDVPRTAGRFIAETFASMDFNSNWAVKTKLQFEPADYKRSYFAHERARYFLNKDRQISIDDQALKIEELKGHFQNDDLMFEFGKLDPLFGTAHRKSKRIGVFVTDFTEDYELIEKIGATVAVLLENSKISVSSFFNDNTGLSNSALRRRGRDNDPGIAGNTSSLSSYSVAWEGKELLGIEDLYYNAGYRYLDTDNTPGRDAETGYVGGLEYLIPVGSTVSLVPFIEIAKLNNASGEIDRNILYTTTALMLRYSGWNFSIANVDRKIRQKNAIGNLTDRATQYSVGYKFENGVMIDVSRMGLREDRKKADLIGGNLSYLYKF